MIRRKSQTAYELPRHHNEQGTVEDRAGTAMFRHLTEDLGWPESVALGRARMEIAGEIARNVCDDLGKLGLDVKGKRVLEIGAGFGGLALEIGRRGGQVI